MKVHKQIRASLCQYHTKNGTFLSDQLKEIQQQYNAYWNVWYGRYLSYRDSSMVRKFLQRNLRDQL